MEFLKEKNSAIIYQKWETWNTSIEIYVCTAGKNYKVIEEYIKNQLKEDALSEQWMLDIEDPFSGNKK